ncbi:MAG TPA: hypothetical protein DEF16_01850 [Gemmobacter sp.]|nr:hypothetical protein [Gemmobacter sp.]
MRDQAKPAPVAHGKYADLPIGNGLKFCRIIQAQAGMAHVHGKADQAGLVDDRFVKVLHSAPLPGLSAKPTISCLPPHGKPC